MSGSIDFEFRFRPAGERPRAGTQGDPLRILVLGDFSGRPGGDLGERRAHAVDLDSFAPVMARLAPRVEFTIEADDGGSVVWQAESLEDFHPDRLYQRLEILAPAVRLRERLLDPDRFAEAAAELKRGTAALAPEPGGNASADSATPAPDEDQSALLDRLLGKPAGAAQGAAQPEPAPRTGQDLSGFIQRLVEPHVVPDVGLEQGQLVSVVEDRLARQLRAVLHHPTWQAMEARWRALDWLVTNLESEEDVRIHVLDLGKADIAADLERAESDPGASVLHKTIVDAGAGDGPGWSLLVGAFAFGSDGQRDVELLAALGTLASHGGGPLLAGADPAVLGCPDWAELSDPGRWRDLDPEAAATWQALRRAPVARWIGLAAPRVLLRLPYGPKTDPIDSFAFDELTARRAHDDYLWGDPAFACALLIGQGFQDSGWSTSPGDRLVLEDLPAHSFTEDGEAKLQACAEVYLGERAAAAILERGPMALLSYRDRNAARLARFQSIADPPAPLAGPWTG